MTNLYELKELLSRHPRIFMCELDAVDEVIIIHTDPDWTRVTVKLGVFLKHLEANDLEVYAVDSDNPETNKYHIGRKRV
jgi:hypothetical protein